MPSFYAPSRSTDAAAVPRYGPRVVVAGSYLQEQESQASEFAMFCAGMITMALIYLIMFILEIVIEAWTGYRTPLAANVIVNVIWVAMGVSLAVRFWRAARRSGAYRRGRIGEELVVEELRTLLDHRWTIFRSLRLPERNTDIDIALVGPGGLYAIEVKNWRFPIRLQGGQWERKTKQGWRPLEQDPGLQARRNAVRIHKVLERRGITQFVQPIVALTQDQALATIDDSETPIWLPATIVAEVVALRDRKTMAMAEVAQVAGILTQPAEKRAAIDASSTKE